MGPSASFVFVNDDVFVCGFSSSYARCNTAATHGLRILILGCLPGNSGPIAPSLLVSELVVRGDIRVILFAALFVSTVVPRSK
jgi:hypothetical protein